MTVTGTRTCFAPASRTSVATASVASGKLTTATPKISGTPKVGSTLKASRGRWGPAGVVLRYQWYADSTAIKGQTGKSLKLAKGQVGKKNQGQGERGQARLPDDSAHLRCDSQGHPLTCSEDWSRWGAEPGGVLHGGPRSSPPESPAVNPRS